MIASPWVEREVRSRMPFGANTDADRAAPAGDAQEQTDEAKVQQRLQSLEDRPPVATSAETPTTLSEQATRLGALEKIGRQQCGEWVCNVGLLAGVGVCLKKKKALPNKQI